MPIFPITGKVVFENLAAPLSYDIFILDCIEVLLNNAQASRINKSHNGIQFRNKLILGTSRFNVLNGIGDGCLNIIHTDNDIKIVYRLNVDRIFVFGIYIGIIFFYVLSLWDLTMPVDNFRYHWKPPVFMTLILIFLNYIVTAIHFPIWLENGLKPKIDSSTEEVV